MISFHTLVVITWILGYNSAAIYILWIDHGACCSILIRSMCYNTGIDIPSCGYASTCRSSIQAYDNVRIKMSRRPALTKSLLRIKHIRWVSNSNIHPIYGYVCCHKSEYIHDTGNKTCWCRLSRAVAVKCRACKDGVSVAMLHTNCGPYCCSVFSRGWCYNFWAAICLCRYCRGCLYRTPVSDLNNVCIYSHYKFTPADFHSSTMPYPEKSYQMYSGDDWKPTWRHSHIFVWG